MNFLPKYLFSLSTKNEIKKETNTVSYFSYGHEKNTNFIKKKKKLEAFFFKTKS